ncbi:Histone deacetylase [Aphelenchoides fujianensis]|nr:Histone deacetylase [Aphelenchoides fujianensis]
MMRFHSPDYINFLQRVTPSNAEQYEKYFAKFNIGEDCPVFDGVFDFCSMYTGGSLERRHAAERGRLRRGDQLERRPAPREEVGSFRLLFRERHRRGHHRTAQVASASSVHRYRHPPRRRRGGGVPADRPRDDRLFSQIWQLTSSPVRPTHLFSSTRWPSGTGDMYDVGLDRGRYYSVNVPLREGMDDESYHQLFKPIITAVMENYDPSVIVLQCGADSLGCDRLGCFNLSFDGHGECVEFVKNLGKPVLVLGGGGYTLRNVARCWTNETAILVNRRDEISNEIPESSPYLGYFAPEFTLRPELAARVDNMNTKEFLLAVKQEVLENLKQVNKAPSVQMQPVPDDVYDFRDLERITKELEDPDGKVDDHI